MALSVKPAESPARQRSGVVTFKGSPLTLLGPELKVGDAAPEFTVADNDLRDAHLSDFAGRVIVLSSVPSLDTPVCDRETRRFNEEAGRLGDTVLVLTISMDLPFAQKRWCGAAGVERVKTLSDYKTASFGLEYGVLIKELHLDARAVFVIDQRGKIAYIQRVREIAEEPDYADVLAAVRKLA